MLAKKNEEVGNQRTKGGIFYNFSTSGRIKEGSLKVVDSHNGKFLLSVVKR